jgi:hypothetical protein
MGWADILIIPVYYGFGMTLAEGNPILLATLLLGICLPLLNSALKKEKEVAVVPFLLLTSFLVLMANLV